MSVGELTFAQREAVAAHRGEIDELLRKLDARAERAGLATPAEIDKQLRWLRDDLQPADRIDLARAIQQCSRVRRACNRYLEQPADSIAALIEIRLFVYRIGATADKLRGDLLQIDEAVAEPA